MFDDGFFVIFADMKIGYDAKRAVNNNTGLGNYSRLVIDTIASTLFSAISPDATD